MTGMRRDTFLLEPRGNRIPLQKYSTELIPPLEKPTGIRLAGSMPFRLDSLAQVGWVSPAGDTGRVQTDDLSPLSKSFGLALPEGRPGRYSLFLEAGSCVDFFDRASDSLDFDISIPTAEDRAELKLRFTAPEGSTRMRAELIRPNGSLLYSGAIDSVSEWKLGWIEPGTYSLRAFEDINGNGRWDPVDWPSKRQPEPLSLFSEAIELKANWEVELEWKPNFGSPVSMPDPE